MKRAATGFAISLVLAAAGCSSDEPAATADASPIVGNVDATVTPAVIRILPLGDSLTLGYGSGQEGAGSEPGYRMHLRELLVDAGISVDFVGTQANGPAALADNEHEGYNGYAVAQVGEVAGPAIDAHAPDIILLLCGTNDQIEFVPPSQPPAGAAADFERLLEQLHARQPGVQIIAGKVIPLSFNDEGVSAYNDLLPAIVDRQRKSGVNVRLVDHYAIGEDALSSDGIHPTQVGYDAMAEVWLPAVLEAVADVSR